VTRVRVRFSKTGKVRFTSHRDVARIWERALRRAEIEVAYSEGFSPHPKLHFGLALSTSYESLGEYLDIDLVDGVEVDVAALPERFAPALPVGFEVQTAAVLEPGTESLQALVTSCSWWVEVADVTLDQLSDAVDRALAADEIVVTRQRKGRDVTDDLRPYLIGLRAAGPTERGAWFEAELGTQPRSLRPAELVAALGDGWTEGRVCRTHQWIVHDNARREPLPWADLPELLLPAWSPSGLLAEARAS
jgi:radical SAM-linked protein